MPNNSEKNINIGINLLKVLMAFDVILGHFCEWDNYSGVFYHFFNALVSLAVPVFVILSFYLMENCIISNNYEKQNKRLYKIIIPQIGWTFIYWFIYFLLNVNEKINISSLFWQLFTGHSMYINPTMWFQIELIIITALFFFIFNKLGEKKGIITITILTCICLFLEVTEINRLMFGELRYELKYPLGRLIEMIPYASIGIYLKYFKIYERINNYKKIVLPLSIVMFCLGFIIPFHQYNDFGFSGFCKPYLAIWIITFAILFPFNSFPKIFKLVANQISKYTLGIYCSHRLIDTLLKIIINDYYLSINSFARCILLYLICYLLCFAISHIPSKHNVITNLIG